LCLDAWFLKIVLRVNYQLSMFSVSTTNYIWSRVLNSPLFKSKEEATSSEI
jgi:hypothetical protein